MEVKEARRGGKKREVTVGGREFMRSSSFLPLKEEKETECKRKYENRRERKKRNKSKGGRRR